jgi:hypothetical protein
VSPKAAGLEEFQVTGQLATTAPFLDSTVTPRRMRQCKRIDVSHAHQSSSLSGETPFDERPFVLLNESDTIRAHDIPGDHEQWAEK